MGALQNQKPVKLGTLSQPFDPQPPPVTWDIFSNMPFIFFTFQVILVYLKNNQNKGWNMLMICVPIHSFNKIEVSVLCFLGLPQLENLPLDV